MIEELLLAFQFVFMHKAFVITAIIAAPTGLLSCYLVLKGWSLMGDAISHAVLPGIVLAYIINIPLIIGAFAAGMVCSNATGFLKANTRVKHDTVMGVVFSGMFGLGIVMYTKIDTQVHLAHILFGNMLGVGMEDIVSTGLISLFVVTAIVLKRRDLLLHAFDPEQAKVVGLSVGVLHYGLLALLSLTIVATLKAVGIILTISLLIAPGAIAFLLTKRFERMLVLSVIVTLISGFFGIYLSFYIDSAPAPTIVLILSTIFIIAFIYQTRRGRQHPQNF